MVLRIIDKSSFSQVSIIICSKRARFVAIYIKTNIHINKTIITVVTTKYLNYSKTKDAHVIDHKPDIDGATIGYMSL